MNIVSFVSLGPGDPELITLKALKKLNDCDLIFTPSTKTVDGILKSRCKDIMLSLNISHSKIKLFNVPMNKQRELAIASYNNIADSICEFYSAGKKIAVVVEGDSGFYSSIHYISDILVKKQVAIETIAGVPAFIAAGAVNTLHIVKQEEQLLVIPGTVVFEELYAELNKGKHIVIMKLSQCSAVIKKCISLYNQELYCYYYENIGCATQYFTDDINTILNKEYPYFSIMIMFKK